MVDVPTIDFVGGLPGFPAARHFALMRVDDDGILYRLRALDTPDLEFVVAAPHPFFPTYAPEIDDETARRLELEGAQDAILLVLLTVGDRLAGSTANLLAPIVVNARSRRAVQVVLDDRAGSLREPLPL